jgi:hypothetical protein
VVYRDVTRQAKGLYRLKYEVALKRGLACLSRCNSGWFCHRQQGESGGKGQELTAVTGWPVLGKRGAEAASRRRTGAGGGTPRGGDGVPVAGG